MLLSITLFSIMASLAAFHLVNILPIPLSRISLLLKFSLKLRMHPVRIKTLESARRGSEGSKEEARPRDVRQVCGL